MASIEFSGSNKRIVKNTLYLYLRMFVMLLVSLYTVRVVLGILGAEDFGLYNVVGGVISITAFVNNSLASASIRFFSYELGRGNQKRLRQLFSTSLTIYIIFALLVLFLGETIGLWFVKNMLNIPCNRLSAALVVYHASIFSLMTSFMRVPYNAIIIARENMKFYSIISIIEVVLKLGLVFLLMYISVDKLKLYALLMFVVSCVIFVVYFLYSRLHFYETRMILIRDRNTYSLLLGFSGWNIMGSMANVFAEQGTNILINIFFSPVVNAAKGIAMQVRGVVSTFVGNFQMAANPQIIKYYSVGELELMKKLLFQSSRFSFFLVLVTAMPTLLGIDVILDIWLDKVPQYTQIFTRLVIVVIIVDSLSGNVIPAIEATGKIKVYQIAVASVKLLNVPFTYLLFSIGSPPYYAIIVSALLNFVCLFVRLYVLQYYLKIKIKDYVLHVLLRDIEVLLCSVTLPILIVIIVPASNLIIILTALLSVITTIISVFFIGMTKLERLKFKELVVMRINRK